MRVIKTVSTILLEIINSSFLKHLKNCPGKRLVCLVFLGLFLSSAITLAATQSNTAKNTLFKRTFLSSTSTFNTNKESTQDPTQNAARSVEAITVPTISTSVAADPFALAESNVRLQPINIANAVRRIEAQIQSSIERKQIPGCAIAIVYRNTVIFMNGYGVRTVGKNDKIDTNTVFQLGSVSKPIAATLATILDEKGKLNIDDPVVQYIPDFMLNSKNDPTFFKIKNVLSHTSGVPRNGFNNLIEKFTPYPEILSAIQRIRAKAPGQKFDYHNAVYSLIGKITEKVTSLPFADALKQHLTHPLQMKSTSATFEGLLMHENRASPHTGSGKQGLRPVEPYSQSYYAVAPAGGINSNAHDMAIFLKAQMGGYPNVITRNVINKMHAPITPTSSSLGGARSSNPAYGLGWRIINYANQKLVYHGGHLNGFTNFLGFLPEQELGIVVLHNSNTKFSSVLAQSFFDVALGLPEIKDVAKPGKGKKGKKAAKAAKSGKAAKSSKAKKAKSGGGKKGKKKKK